MSTVASTQHPVGHGPVRHATELDRVWRVAKLHLVNKMTYIGIPWIIIGFAFLVSIVVAGLIRATGGTTEGMQYSWAVLSPLWYLVVVAIQAISLTFPFALGFSVTRRDFYLGTALLFVLFSAANSIALTILTYIEKASDGFGIGMHMFTALWFGTEPWYVDLLSYFVFQLFICFVGAAVATIYMRWRMIGMLITGISFVLLVLAVVSIATLTNGWPAIAAWFTSLGVTGVFGWLLVPTVLAGLGGFFVLRGATPKN